MPPGPTRMKRSLLARSDRPTVSVTDVAQLEEHSPPKRAVEGSSPSGRAVIEDVADDGLTDEEIAARTLAWIEKLRSVPIVRPSEAAALAVRELRDGEP